MIKITFVSAQGGVDKTPLPANLGSILAASVHCILRIEPNLQPTLSCDYQLKRQADHELTQRLFSASTDAVINQTEIGFLGLVSVTTPTGNHEKRSTHTLNRRSQNGLSF